MNGEKSHSFGEPYNETKFIDYVEFFQWACLLEDAKTVFTGKREWLGGGRVGTQAGFQPTQQARGNYYLILDNNKRLLIISNNLQFLGKTVQLLWHLNT